MKAPKEQVLYYYQEESSDVTLAKRVFALMGVRMRRLATDQLGRTVGALAGILEEEEQAPSQEPPADDIMIFCGFTERRLDTLLSFFHKAGVSKASYKAMLTPTNALWTVEELYLELQKERREIEGRS